VLAFAFEPPCITSAKKSLPLSSITMNAGKSTTSIVQIASMPTANQGAIELHVRRQR
jgi:hypothetical protein